MSNPDMLPGDPAERLAYLERATAHGEALRPLLATGAPAGPIAAYLADHPDLVGEREGSSLAIRYGEWVRWDVTLGEGDRIEGCSTSGYGPLMAVLGIDFSGRPYSADD